MPNQQLTWGQGAAVGLVLLTLAAVLARAGSDAGSGVGSGVGPRLAPFAREAGVIAVLYATWQLAGTVAQSGTAGGLRRGAWIARTERAWSLPAERTLQRPLLEHPLLAESANVYYATMHFTALFVLLLWLFLRHRDHYPPVRTVLAVSTFACLIIEFFPVAPPRLMPASFGFTDIAALHGQSVYQLGALAADQLSAMPSVHVGWSLIVGLVPVRYGAGRWRWLAMAHPVITMLVVVATGNHWWLDGIVAAAVLAATVGVLLGWARLRRPGVAAVTDPGRRPGPRGVGTVYTPPIRRTNGCTGTDRRDRAGRHGPQSRP